MSLETIKGLNPEFEFHTVDEPLFETFGRVLNYDIKELTKNIHHNYPMPLVKSEYIPKVELSNYPVLVDIQKDIYGELPIQTGIVHGYNQSLTGIEYHQGSEVNVAIMDCVLLLGKRYDMKNNTFHSNQATAFYVKAGQCIEIFSDTLHYTPIQVNKDGFSMIVILLDGTNTPLDTKAEGMLIKKNKWYITHASQTAKVEAGNLPNLLGELITIQYQ